MVINSAVNRIIVCLIIFVLLTSMLVGCENDSGQQGGIVSETKNGGEVYSVSLAFPAQNKTFKRNDSPPTFYWSLHEGYPKTYIIDIDYLNDGSYMSRTVNTGTSYIISEDDWTVIKNNAPIIEGLQRVNWRIRIIYDSNSEESYCTGWSYFWISAE